MLYYGKEMTAYKAALHMHSTVSDGDFTPEEMIKAYSEHGYQIYAFTDHSISNHVSTYDGKGMLLISGMEIHPDGPRGVPWHLLALGVPEDFISPDTDKNATAQQCINAVHAVGGLMFCAHPAWCGFRSSDVATVQGWDGMEVFNSSTRYAGKQFNMHVQNELADDGILLNSLAVDDAHLRRDFFNGWTMILTDKPLTVDSVMEALRQGNFYATQGPEFKSITFENGILSAEFTPCMEVIGISNMYRGYLGMCENITAPEDGIQEVTSCSFNIKYDIPHSWIRLQIKDIHGKYAWSNPIRLSN